VVPKTKAELLLHQGQEVRVTHPGQALFLPGGEASQLARCVLPSVATGALAGIRDRPIVLKRFLNGAERKLFIRTLTG